ncbi:MAG: DUF3883 domain-containing protein [Bacilli bacterium]|nr:DUF3883 domain-containing protein [Bacilli bacterium]
MRSLDLIQKYSLTLNEKGINSFEDIKNNIEEITNTLEEEGYTVLLKMDINNFLDIFFKERFPYRRAVFLEKMIRSNRCHYSAKYIISLYCGQEKAYRNTPLFIKALIDKLEINEYRYITLDTIKSITEETFTLDKFHDKKYGDLIEVYIKEINPKYKKYKLNYNYDKPNNINDRDDLYIWAEHRVFDDECLELSKSGCKEYVMWLSSDMGDGYGFDILSLDLITRKEKLIEVKAGKGQLFTLTENETKVMRECHKKNADYYIYKYTCKSNDEEPILSIYKYDSETDRLIDENNDEYEVKGPYKYLDENGVEKSYFAPSKLEKEKVFIKEKAD